MKWNLKKWPSSVHKNPPDMVLYQAEFELLVF